MIRALSTCRGPACSAGRRLPARLRNISAKRAMTVTSPMTSCLFLKRTSLTSDHAGLTPRRKVAMPNNVTAKAGLLVCALLWPAFAEIGASGAPAIPIFAPDDRTSWFPDRPMGDDFLPPPSGPGPVLADPKHPYTPNDEGRNTGVQPTYRIADLSNPILQPWAREQMKKANDEVLAGGVP